MFKPFMRLYQKIMFISSFILPWREPEIIAGDGSEEKLVELFKQKNWTSTLFVTGPNIYRRGLPLPLIEKLTEAGIMLVLFKETEPNPPIRQVEECVNLFNENSCTAIIGFGGGSPMDLAKATAARIARPNKTIPKLKGVLKVLRKTPPLIAIPTTSGSGSETTLAAVITDSEHNEKYAINDPQLIPAYALLNPEYTINMPPHVTAGTGMDAVTHAVEAYIGKSNTKYTKQKAESAIQLLLKYLSRAYENGTDLEARAKVQTAAYDAGCAFTRAYVGYVHALSHAVSAFYNTPHGYTNAVIMPYVLRAYGKAAHKPLAHLARQNGLAKAGSSDAEAAAAMIERIDEMRRQMDIPEHLKEIQSEDIPAMADHAAREANPLYPVPKIFNKDELAELYRKIQGGN